MKSPSIDFDGSGEILRGRREIMAFLQVKCWRTVKRYEKEHGLPILRGPGLRPIALKSAIIRHTVLVSEKMQEKASGK
jgi:hypothetical protein